MTRTIRSGFIPFTGGAILVLVLVQLFEPAPRADGQENKPPKEAPPNMEARMASLLPYERDIVQVFQRVSPAVVNVSNIAQRRAGFFSMSVQEIPQGTGTGFVWDKQGHVITNFHVVANADAVSVNFADQTQKRAKVVGVYRDKDIAVLQIDSPPEKLTPIDPGTSHDLLVGQTVLAIGNPFGLDHTLTTGVVSAVGREIKALTGRTIADVIQTDASINPGNSGGPLLDSHGRLIGMNTAIFSPSGASAGIGFAIPVDIIKNIVTQLIGNGKVVRPGMGVEMFPDRVADQLHIAGAIISRVMPGSSAAKAGLRGTERDPDGDIVLGDVIVKVDGKKITDYDELATAMEKFKIGDTVELTYLRGGRERTAKVVLQPIGE
jgi:S1-C subfamily serine protease